MRLRICDGERERTAPASLELVQEAFAQHPVGEGHEIALADGARWLAAVAVLKQPGGEVEYVVSGETGNEAPISGRLSRSEAVQRFREFLDYTQCHTRAGQTG
ncbi:MAG TPA: hypothetical protein VF252_10210 [Gemmatimonadales bacterium]